MDTNILGLLMIGNWTIYEMRKMIETNFTSISSSSLGKHADCHKEVVGDGMHYLFRARRKRR